MKRILTLIVFILSIQIQAQSVKEILEKVQQKNAVFNYKVSLKYRLYKGLSGDKILEEFNGVIIKEGTRYYNKIHHTETIMTKKFFVKVNHDEKAIIYAKKTIKKQTDNITDISKLLTHFENPNVKTKDEFWVVEMLTKEYSPLPFSKLVITINKKDYTVKKQVLILSQLTNFAKEIDKNDINLPRIEMLFKDYRITTKNDLTVFDKSNYISVNNNKIVASNNLKNYDIIK